MIPVDYSFCDRTVTIYRMEQGQVRRLVVENCYYNYQDVLRDGVSGRRLERLFLLIMPGQCQEVFPGDLIYDGIGPESEDINWAKFLPAAVPGLSQAAYVRPWHWDGKIAHVEAGRK